MTLFDSVKRFVAREVRRLNSERIAAKNAVLDGWPVDEFGDTHPLDCNCTECKLARRFSHSNSDFTPKRNPLPSREEVRRADARGVISGSIAAAEAAIKDGAGRRPDSAARIAVYEYIARVTKGKEDNFAIAVSTFLEKCGTVAALPLLEAYVVFVDRYLGEHPAWVHVAEDVQRREVENILAANRNPAAQPRRRMIEL